MLKSPRSFAALTSSEESFLLYSRYQAPPSKDVRLAGLSGNGRETKESPVLSLRQIGGGASNHAFPGGA